MRGTDASQITNIEHDGFWMLTQGSEYLVAFEDYPDFRNATIAQIFNFKQSLGGFH